MSKKYLNINYIYKMLLFIFWNIIEYKKYNYLLKPIYILKIIFIKFIKEIILI